MQRFEILQSGFVTNTTEGFIKPSIHKDIVIDDVLAKDFRTTGNRSFYSAAAVTAYEKWEKRPTLVNTFEFRQEILLAALNCFNSISMYQWLMMQNKTANISPMHEKFIVDTLLFINGKARSIQPAQWITLIEKTDTPYNIRIDIDAYFDIETNRTHGSSECLLPSPLESLLTLWVSRIGGFEDLLITLYVIFGYRPYISNVAEKYIA